MQQSLLEWDIEWFKLINGQWHVAFLDWVMPWWRDKTTWIPAYLALLAFLFYTFRKNAFPLVLAAILCAGLSDIASSKIMKPTFKRLRPCNTPELQYDVRLLSGCGKAYSFTSSHAANHFALATFLSLTLGIFYRKIRPWLYLWAASIAYGQVYVGVHYPSDVLVGAILGWTIGNMVANLYFRLPKAIRLAAKG
jgi:undecaprenyl-diphosphatase